MNNDIFKRAPHNPPHLFLPDALYMLTASTYQREHLMCSPARKMEWIEAFLKAAEIYEWRVIAWVILHNHYHAIVQSPENATNLSQFTGSYHKFTSRKWTDQEQCAGRQVWWNYWDTCLLSEHDYYTRLRYVFWNPVKHGICNTPEEYQFSNYREFLANWDVDFNFAEIDEVTDVPEF